MANCELDAQTVRQKGLGQLFSLVLESEQVESLGVGGVISGALAVIELGFATVLLLLAANDPVALRDAFSLITLALRIERHISGKAT